MKTQSLFIRLISHELRTPMNSAFLGLDLLSAEMTEKNCSDDSFHVLYEVKEACEISISLLNNLLLDEKLKNGILLFHKTLVPAFQLVMDITTSYYYKVNIIYIYREYIYI